ncbi:MAG: hypothetical protein Q8P93_04545 [bacterium]|nr:hypothetical protein [bacterium]
MQHIENLLARFKRLTVPHESVRKMVIDVCREECNVHLEMADISVRNRVVFVSGSPHIKMTLYTHKKRILERLRVRIGADAPTDVR